MGAARDIVADFLAGDRWAVYGRGVVICPFCSGCGPNTAEVEHGAECPVKRAQRLIAEDPSEEGD